MRPNGGFGGGGGCPSSEVAEFTHEEVVDAIEDVADALDGMPMMLALSACVAQSAFITRGKFPEPPELAAMVKDVSLILSTWQANPVVS